jgi:hypothetical protein
MGWFGFALPCNTVILVFTKYADGPAQFFANGMRPMKPFGVRLAAGAVTILLGAIMAAQAQKDHQDELHTSWNPLNHATEHAGEAPAPT